MTYGLGAGESLGVALEASASPGTFSSTNMVFVPFISESLTYQDAKYISEAMRSQTIANDVRSGYYHVEGDITIEVDTRWMPYFLLGSRSTHATGATIKTGSAPYAYTFTSSSSASITPENRTLSIQIVRNGVGFQYSGCMVTQYEFTIDTGVLRCTMHVIGTTQATTGSPVAATYAAPRMLAAQAHTLYMADGAVTTSALTPGPPVTATTPMVALTPVATNWNTFTCTVNDNGVVQNRIQPTRAASFVSLGITEITLTTQLDFLNSTDYAHFVNTDRKSIQFVSLGDTADVAAPATTNRMVLNLYNNFFNAYTVAAGAWGDLVMADVTLQTVSSGGAAPPFDLTFFTDQAITIPA